MDFNNSSANSFFHAYAHLHIGFRNSIRIPVDEVFLFSEFLAFILYLFYLEQFSLLFGSKYATTNTRRDSEYGIRVCKPCLSLYSNLRNLFYLINRRALVAFSVFSLFLTLLSLCGWASLNHIDTCLRFIIHQKNDTGREVPVSLTKDYSHSSEWDLSKALNNTSYNSS